MDQREVWTVVEEQPGVWTLYRNGQVDRHFADADTADGWIWPELMDQADRRGGKVNYRRLADDEREQAGHTAAVGWVLSW